MAVYTITEVDACYVIAADDQDVLVCEDRRIALSVAAAAVVTQDNSANVIADVEPSSVVSLTDDAQHDTERLAPSIIVDAPDRLDEAECA